jgi:hypothetical protein
MPYSRELSSRIEALLAELAPQKKEMFGGVGYLLHGNMLCGVIGDNLVLRVGPGQHESVLAHPQARPFDMTGRPMHGWAVILPEGFQTAQELSAWIGLAMDFNATLPEK